jgi:hypothetical protein
MEVWGLTEHESRLLALGGSFVAVDTRYVNIDDLLAAHHPGSIVRCDGNPNDAIKVQHFDNGPLGVVAGWISEDET